MKLIKFLFLVILFNGASHIHADLGMHNFQINVGGGYLSSAVPHSFYASDLGFSIEVPEFDFDGPVFKAEIAYLLHGVHSSGVVNGLDIRANFMMSWRKGEVLRNPTGEITQSGQSLGGGFQVAYTLGAQLKDGSRLMFDIIGFGISSHRYDVTRTIDYADDRDSKTKNLGITSSIASEYILPGVHYISKSGLTIGVRNIIQIPLYNDNAYVSNERMYHYSSYNLMPYSDFITSAYVGFTFGK